MSAVFSAVAVRNLLACPDVFLVYCKDFFKQGNCRIPFLIVFVPVVKFLKKDCSLVVAERF